MAEKLRIGGLDLGDNEAAALYQKVVAQRALADAEIEKIFSYHPPKVDQLDRYDLLRKAGGQLARVIVRNTPASPEQQKAIDCLDDAVKWANAAIARRE